MSGKKGFTLIEILIALVILSGAALLLLQARSGNTHRIDKVQSYYKAVHLLKKKMTELEMDWMASGFSSIPDSEEGDFESEKNFSWSVQTQAMEVPDLQNSMNLGAMNESALLVMRTAREFLLRAIREVKLTVHHKKGKNVSRYSLTTYVVNYNQEVSLSIPEGGF